MNRTPFGLDLRRSRALLVWLGVITAAYAGFITVFYTNVAENAEEFEKLLDVYPKELLIAFGIEANFADPGVFLSGYVFNFLWPLIITDSVESRPVTVGLQVFSSTDQGIDWSIISAATLLTTGPLLIAFLLFQRQFVQSFMRAGIR